MVSRQYNMQVLSCDFVFPDGIDTICLEVLIRLLHPRGLAMNAVFTKKIEVNHYYKWL